ncbi:MAG: hypothetical protein OXC68_15525 [Aestuariivita sp.]|nr:hypothetical protein [Aestuariivita sp.]
MSQFHNGSGKTAKIGFLNKHEQMCLGTRGKLGNHYNQKSYMMICLKEKLEGKICGHLYGSNGCDIFLRRCPCDDTGAADLEF